MNASKRKEWTGLALSIALAAILALGAVASLGGSSSANDDPYTIEVQTPDQAGTAGMDKGVKRFQTTDAHTFHHSQSSTH